VLTVRYERLGVQAGDRLLDLGSGGGRHAFEAMRRGALVTALDADAGEVKDVSGMMKAVTAEEPAVAARGGVGTAIVGDALRLPFSSDAFDRVIAAEVLEHIPEDRIAMSELARVLRPGGTMAVTVPRWWPELLTWALSDDYHNTPGGHIRIYRRSALVESVERGWPGVLRRPSRPRPPHPVLVAAGDRRSPRRPPSSRARPITGCWSGTSRPTRH
jgi:SAM-dependent methyltransferase